jgi:hypothetical protein
MASTGVMFNPCHRIHGPLPVADLQGIVTAIEGDSTMTDARTIRSSFSMSVADYIRDGYSCSEALQIVLGGIRDGSGPRTSDVLLDLEEMGVWSPVPPETEELPASRM